jgi:hypothetical protein
MLNEQVSEWSLLVVSLCVVLVYFVVEARAQLTRIRTSSNNKNKPRSATTTNITETLALKYESQV